MGFRGTAEGRAKGLSVGDRLLGYVIDRIGFVGAMEVVGEVTHVDDESIWGTREFPIRLPVRLLLQLPIQDAVPIMSVIESLPRLKKAQAAQAGAWAAYIRGAPRKWPRDEALVVMEALERARMGILP